MIFYSRSKSDLAHPFKFIAMSILNLSNSNQGIIIAHEIDITTGRAAMAYVGNKPWHGLGQKLASINVITQRN
jgi:hypothetical protein